MKIDCGNYHRVSPYMKLKFCSDTNQMNQQQKRDYLDSKTEGISFLGIGLFILGILAGGHNLESKNKKQIFGKACIAASAITIFASVAAKLYYGSKYNSNSINKPFT